MRSPPLRTHANELRVPNKTSTLRLGCLLFALLGSLPSAMAQSHPQVLNTPPDVSEAFSDARNSFFLPAYTASLNPATGAGMLGWGRHRLGGGMLFNHRTSHYEKTGGNEWPGNMYAADPELPFRVSFVDARTVRIRFSSTPVAPKEAPSLMLTGEPKDTGEWKGSAEEGGWRFRSHAGSVFIGRKPFSIELRDASERLLTRSVHGGDIGAFGFVRRAEDYSRSFTAAFSLSPGERLFGGGESFTGLDKRGQRMALSTTDVLGSESAKLYKPVPFFLSSRGYGIFLHTSTPISADLGATHTGRASFYVADANLDLFLFLGEPKDVLGSYTALTGRASMPPLWSFGLWMSRITYKSEEETRDVAKKLRENRIPSDVIHLDTGWFQNDWECDYKFSADRFTDPARMISDLRAQGFRISLWQLPYFVPRNPLFLEIVAKGLAVRDASGALPTEDAILDFSNPETVTWYQEKLAGLLKLGVGAIKTDFAEAAPYNGLYASGATGLHEHNLYPLRYQQAAAEVTRRITGDSIIWARAGWAGAQRNGVHWAGDAGKSFPAMAATLRGGLSLGVSGFQFWSHDIGGFGGWTDAEVYRKWLPFGMLSSHARVHGEPPKEPWLIGDGFIDQFRAAAELRYRLLPYIYSQAKVSVDTGLPMLRALFLEFPQDPGAWTVEDAYLLGSDLYVAPLFEADATEREVYLPGGGWIDYQTGQTYSRGWHRISVGAIPAVVLVREGSVLPHCALAQSTDEIDWTNLELRLYANSEIVEATAPIFFPGAGQSENVRVTRTPSGLQLSGDPTQGRVKWKVTDAVKK